MHAHELPAPPHNTEAEMAALGSMLLNRTAADKLLHTLDESDFYSPVHREIFLAMRGIASMFRPLDFVTLRDELVSRNMLDRVGGVDYLMQIAEAVPRLKTRTITRRLSWTVRCFASWSEQGTGSRRTFTIRRRTSLRKSSRPKSGFLMFRSAERAGIFG